MDPYLLYRTVKDKVQIEGDINQNLQDKWTNTSKIKVKYNKAKPNYKEITRVNVTAPCEACGKW